MEISKEEMIEIYKQVIIENTKEKEHKKEIEGISKEVGFVRGAIPLALGAWRSPLHSRRRRSAFPK